MARQLKEQQDAINNMSPDEILDRIAKYKELGRKGAFPDDAAARAAERALHEAQLVEQYTSDFRLQGNAAEAERLARMKAASEMKNLDVTHTLDLRAGGSGETSGLGDSKVNRSIGSQWQHGRADALEEEAKKAKARGQEKMNVKLEKC